MSFQCCGGYPSFYAAHMTPENEPTKGGLMLSLWESSFAIRLRRSFSELLGPSDAPSSAEVELLKLEYERAAVRYENIYKAIWQNFYYMAVLAGGIIAFGPRAIPLALLAALALLPLVIWFWATYLPMDRYGQQVRSRLGAIEEILNRTVFNESSESRAPYADPRMGDVPVRRGLGTYQLFYGEERKDRSSARIWPAYRVRRALCAFGVSVTTACVLFLGWSFSRAIGWSLGQALGWEDSVRTCIFIFVAVLTLAISVYCWKKFIWIFKDSDMVPLAKWLIIGANVLAFVVMWLVFLVERCASDSGLCLLSWLSYYLP